MLLLADVIQRHGQLRLRDVLRAEERDDAEETSRRVVQVEAVQRRHQVLVLELLLVGVGPRRHEVLLPCHGSDDL